LSTDFSFVSRVFFRAATSCSFWASTPSLM
jgi:hypothetical protein